MPRPVEQPWTGISFTQPGEIGLEQKNLIQDYYAEAFVGYYYPKGEEPSTGNIKIFLMKEARDGTFTIVDEVAVDRASQDMYALREVVDRRDWARPELHVSYRIEDGAEKLVRIFEIDPATLKFITLDPDPELMLVSE